MKYIVSYREQRVFETREEAETQAEFLQAQGYENIFIEEAK